jgi:hypothetical protein
MKSLAATLRRSMRRASYDGPLTAGGRRAERRRRVDRWAVVVAAAVGLASGLAVAMVADESSPTSSQKNEVESTIYIGRRAPGINVWRPPREEAWVARSHEMTVTNDAEHYSFRYPATWRLRQRGGITRVAAQRGEAVITFGPGPPGSLSRASRRYFAALKATYDRVHAVPHGNVVNGAAARQLLGSLTNERQARIRFNAMLVPGRRTNYAIAAFYVPDVAEVEATVDEVLTSFELPRPPPSD